MIKMKSHQLHKLSNMSIARSMKKFGMMSVVIHGVFATSVVQSPTFSAQVYNINNQST